MDRSLILMHAAIALRHRYRFANSGLPYYVGSMANTQHLIFEYDRMRVVQPISCHMAAYANVAEFTSGDRYYHARKMVSTLGVKPAAWANAAEFTSGDRYYHASKMVSTLGVKAAARANAAEFTLGGSLPSR